MSWVSNLVDTYDRVAAETEDMEPIRGSIVNSYPGEPETYSQSDANFLEAIKCLPCPIKPGVCTPPPVMDAISGKLMPSGVIP